MLDNKLCVLISDMGLLKIDQSFPMINKGWSKSLIEYRIKLLTLEPITFKGGESKVVPTNCIIEEDRELSMYLKANPDLNLACEERFIFPQKQTLTVKLSNLDGKVKKIPTHFCIGYLIITY